MVPVHARMKIDNFLNAEGEEDVYKILYGADLVEEALMPNRQDEESDDEEHEVPLTSLARQLQTLALAKSIVSARSGTENSALRAINRVQAFIRSDLASTSRQKTIQDFFTAGFLLKKTKYWRIKNCE